MCLGCVKSHPNVSCCEPVKIMDGEKTQSTLETGDLKKYTQKTILLKSSIPFVALQ